MSDDIVGQRKTWCFRYSSKELEKAASRLVNYHAEREAYWKQEQERATEELKTSSINVREYHRVSEAYFKGEDHRKLKLEFQKWVTLFSHENIHFSDRDLDPNDIEYFWIGRDLPTEDE